MIHNKKLHLFLRALITIIVLLGTNPIPVSASHLEFKNRTPIQHFIVVMQQNHTFDNYFGTYPPVVDSVSPSTCMPFNLSDPDTFCVKPFHIGTYPLIDMKHTKRTFDQQFNNGQMNGFVDAIQRSNQDGKLSMGYYNGDDLGYYWNLADEYVLFDRYFSSAYAGSIPNRMFSVAGVPGADNNKIPANGFGNLPTIFDRLQEKGISWKFYVNNYDPQLNYRTVKDLSYLPPQVQWLPLLGFDRFIDNPKLSSHIVDLKEYYTDLQNGTLPAVSYVLLLGATEHPLSDPKLGQRETKIMIQSLMRSDAWKSSAFLITYDESGSWYDHVPPPQIDTYGLGFRVPALLVSPYARRGYIDSTQLEHTSILKFIEDNWGLLPLAERDAKANNIVSGFDFSKPPRDPVFVSYVWHPQEASINIRRIVIYVSYGLALAFAGTMLLLVAISETRQRAKLPDRPLEDPS
jgi:phospholipase C